MRSNLIFKKKLDEVFFLEPNKTGFTQLDNLYKKITVHLKTMPFIIIIPLSFLLVVFFYLLFGSLVVGLTSVLQYGF